MDNGWEIPPGLKKLAIAKVGMIATKSDNPRDVIAAVRVLISADLLNAKREETEQKNQHHAEALDEQRRFRILAVANRLGITGIVDGIVRGGPDGSNEVVSREQLSGADSDRFANISDREGPGFNSEEEQEA